MSAKHTPGPWFIEMRPHAAKVRIIAGPAHRAIAETLTSVDNDDIANGRLIATAPLLLESLKLALEIFERGKLGEVSPSAKVFEDTMRQLIAKAEGR